MRFGRLAKARGGATAGVVALVVGVLAFGLSGVVSRPASPKFELTAGKAFSITSAVYAYPACVAPTVALEPGVTRCLAVTVHNPLTVSIRVKTLSMTVTSFTATSSNHHLPACTKTMVTPPTFTATFTVTAGLTHTIYKPIRLTTTNTTQDNCENGTFHFHYTATAQFTDGTKTVLTVTPSTTTQGSTVTFTATVTGKNKTYDGTTKPKGKVTLYRCTAKTTCATLTTPVTVTITGTTGVATFATSLLPQGTLFFEAVYPGTGTNFTTSTSNIVTVTIKPPVSVCLTVPTTKATKVITGTYTGNLIVPPFTSVYLNGGTITGNVQVAFFGSFAGNGGTIDGNLYSAGLVSLQGTTVKGTANAAGALAIGADTSIGKNLNVNLALALCAIGTAASPITVTGSVSVHGLPIFFSLAKLCGMKVKHTVTYSFNAAAVELGGSGCPGDTFGGKLVMQHNLGAVTVETNSVTGGITASYNAIIGNLTVSSNTASVVVSNNSVTGAIVVSSNSGTTTVSTTTGKSTLTVSSNGGKVTVASDTMTGSITVSSNKSTVTVTKDTLGSTLTVSSNTGSVVVTHNSVTGAITVSSNSKTTTVSTNTGKSSLTVTGNGKVTIGKNTVSGSPGSITVSGNKGGTLTSNKASMTCSLSGDSPVVKGTLNTAPVSNTCNRTA